MTLSQPERLVCYYVDHKRLTEEEVDKLVDRGIVDMVYCYYRISGISIKEIGILYDDVLMENHLVATLTTGELIPLMLRAGDRREIN